MYTDIRNNPAFIHCYISMQKFPLSMAKHCTESLTLSCFWSKVSKRSTHFEQSSCNIKPTRVFDILTISANSRNFTFRSFKRILWSFLKLSSVVTSFGCPLRFASSVSLRPLKSSNYVLFSSYCFAWTVFFLIKKQCIIKTRNRVFHCFENYKNSVTVSPITQILTSRLSWNFNLLTKKMGNAIRLAPSMC